MMGKCLQATAQCQAKEQKPTGTSSGGGDLGGEPSIASHWTLTSIETTVYLKYAMVSAVFVFRVSPWPHALHPTQERRDQLLPPLSRIGRCGPLPRDEEWECLCAPLRDTAPDHRAPILFSKGQLCWCGSL